MDIMLQRTLELVKAKRGDTKKLAEFIGISPNVITDWKSGRNASYRKHAPKIAEYYGVSLDWLCGKTDIKEKHPDDEIGALNDDENIMLAMYRSVPADQKKTLRAMIEAALKSQGLL